MLLFAVVAAGCEGDGLRSENTPVGTAAAPDPVMAEATPAPIAQTEPATAAPTPKPRRGGIQGETGLALQKVGVEDLHAAIRKHRGRAVLLDVWATWCGPCVEQFPHLSEWQQKFGRDKLAVVALSIDSTGDVQEKVLPFLQKQNTRGLELLLYAKGDHDTLVNSIDPKWAGEVPALFIYDAEGNLRHSLPGEHKPAEVEQKIEETIKD